jgi:hypothetical protein
MAEKGVEPTGSMGDDIPLAILSKRPRLLYDYFRQLFAQVTNPPLDAIREKLVTALSTTLGASCNLFAETPRALPPAASGSAHPDTGSPGGHPRHHSHGTCGVARPAHLLALWPGRRRV